MVYSSVLILVFTLSNKLYTNNFKMNTLKLGYEEYDSVKYWRVLTVARKRIFLGEGYVAGFKSNNTNSRLITPPPSRIGPPPYLPGGSYLPFHFL